jgi:hypothetical protein
VATVPSSRYLFECSLVLRVGQLGGELAAFGGQLSILGDGFMHGSPRGTNNQIGREITMSFDAN